ncbi:hypothetical protein HBI56_182480 [Parastagonospora nodorum]|uniref:Uncharacterized protein n=1 Tax=Phaeosphaeria nodorum (strain SN15 / ATCC MYA-4574 / FGSC 10173) TaxID=321614 RepID=A0A7U2F941_PHANO|nr:hypothetical protein HBH56_187890 [Parastagonospora nodorum]QRD00932.1 hypothetical protein JI435_415970 [Parastagonospora nodorum SN15]KAH3925415.1 hypothetical protein HBH54_180660 [Parastagonospora nodorum]KAH3953200.1 hypothetical protein HBH53_035350 [Parastagonospora nodorum]KAH3959125.1 hypothetical protein HBH52_246410 [Parastagonospora nodorum]
MSVGMFVRCSFVRPEVRKTRYPHATPLHKRSTLLRWLPSRSYVKCSGAPSLWPCNGSSSGCCGTRETSVSPRKQTLPHSASPLSTYQTFWLPQHQQLLGLYKALSLVAFLSALGLTTPASTGWYIY